MAQQPTRTAQRGSPPSSRGTAAVSGKSETTLDPIRTIRQNLLVLILSGVAGLVLGLIVYFALSMYMPRYSEKVLFELQPMLSEANEIVSRDVRNEDLVVRLAQTEAARLKSRDVLTKALQSREILATSWSQGFQDQNGRFIVDDAVDELEMDLSAGHVRNTQYFSMSWSAGIPADVPIVLNTIADTYIDRRQAADEARFANSLSVFTKQRESIDGQLQRLATEVSAFIRENDITSLDERYNQGYAAIQNLALSINETRSAVALTSSRLEQVESKLSGTLEPSSSDLRFAEQDVVAMQMQRQVQDLRVKLQHNRDKFSEDHYSVRDIKKLLNAAESEHDDIIAKLIQRNLASQFKELGDQLGNYTKVLESLQGEFSAQESSLKELSAHMSELQSKQQRQERMESRRDEVQSLINQLNQLRLRDEARAVTIAERSPTPRVRSFPKMLIIVPLVILMSIGFVGGIVFLREFLDHRIRYASDLNSLAAGHMLGVIPDREDDPTSPKRAEFCITDEPASVLAEMVRQMVAQVHQAVVKSDVCSLTVTSAMPKSGTTTIITNLAVAAESAGQKVLVIDANFRRPRIAELFELDSNTPGLGEVLAGEIDIEGSIQSTRRNVDVLTAGAEQYRVFDRIHNPRFDAILSVVSARYDLILIDAPPTVVSGDSAALVSRSDGTLLTVRAFKDERGLIYRLVRDLSGLSSKFLGVVLNRPRNTAGGYFKKNYAAIASYANGDKK